MRVFVALVIPNEIRDHLVQLAPSRPFMQAVEWENFHLTLRFIGKVDYHMLRDIDLALSRISHPPIVIRTDQPSWFGVGKNVRALILRIFQDAPLMAFQKKIDRSLYQCGVPVARRKFYPHITLARMRSVKIGKIEPLIAALSLEKIPPFHTTQMALYSSHAGSDGYLYQAEAIYPLTLLPAGNSTPLT